MIIPYTVSTDKVQELAAQLIEFYHQEQALITQWQMAKYKAWLKHPATKAFLKIQNFTMKLVRYFMRGLNYVERGIVFRSTRKTIMFVSKLVHQDGLRVAILLTVMGYAVWNYQMIA